MPSISPFTSSSDVAHPVINEILPAATTSQAVRPTNLFKLDTAREHILGQTAEFFFGENNALTNGSFEDVTASGGDLHWPTAAAKVKIASTHAADTAAGLGLRSVEIHGLDATGAAIDEVIALNGVTAVESVNSYVRLTLMHNETVGTYGGSHQGTITCRVTNATFANGALLATMTGLEGASGSSVQFGYGEAQLGFTSIPLGKVGYITKLEVVPTSAKPIDVVLYERDSLLTVAAPFVPRRILWSADELEAPVEKEFNSFIKVKSLTDIWFRAEGTVNSAGVSVSLEYYLVDEDAEGQ